jgi:hypothetical protein
MWNIEEVGFQAHEKFSQVRELLGIDFPKVPNYNYRALRLHVQPVVEASERKGCSRRTIE